MINNTVDIWRYILSLLPTRRQQKKNNNVKQTDRPTDGCLFNTTLSRDISQGTRTINKFELPIFNQHRIKGPSNKEVKETLCDKVFRKYLRIFAVVTSPDISIHKLLLLKYYKFKSLIIASVNMSSAITTPIYE